jgi:predicted phage terminase large subunit-like protein
VQLHKAQQDFRLDNHLYRGFVGGRGAGKTWVGAYDLLRRVLPGRTYLVVSPTYTLLDDTTLPAFLALAQQLGVFRGLKLTPRPSVRIACGRKKSRAVVRFRSAEEPDKLRGPNLSGVWLDEASLMAQAVYDVVIACLREARQQGWLSATFTPKGRTHWTFNLFGRHNPDTALFHAQTRDNPFNPPGFEDTLRQQYTSAYAEQELSGLFVDLAGALFRRHWFGIVDAAPLGLSLVRRWDFAGSKPKPGRKEPDWTAGLKMGRSAEGRYYVLDVRRVRDTPGAVEALVRQTAELDSPAVPVRIEQEPGSAGLFVVDQFVRTVLPGWDVKGLPSSGDKAARARPLAAQAEAGNVFLVRGPWNKDFLDEVEMFPAGAHDDQVDAASGAFQDLTGIPLGSVLSGGRGAVDQMPPGTFHTRPGQMPPGVFYRKK